MYRLTKTRNNGEKRMEKRKRRDIVPFLFKLDRELYEFLRELATARYSNMTAEVRRLILEEMERRKDDGTLKVR